MSSTSRMDDEERHYKNLYEDYAPLNSMNIINHTTNDVCINISFILSDFSRTIQIKKYNYFTDK